MNVYLVLCAPSDYQPEHVASTLELAEEWIRARMASGQGADSRDDYLIVETPVDGKMPAW